MANVKLEDYEIDYALQVADLRYGSSRAMGIGHNFKFKGGESEIAADQVGALGEMAFGKFMNMYWCPNINTFKHKPDFAPCIEIKTRRYKQSDLHVKPHELIESHFYVLVTPDSNDIHNYTVVGWIEGKYVPQKIYWGDPGDRQRKCWSIPQHALVPDFELLRRRLFFNEAVAV